MLLRVDALCYLLQSGGSALLGWSSNGVGVKFSGVMLKRYFQCLYVLFITVGSLPLAFAATAISPQRVVVVANENDPASVALAKFYLEKRNIPAKNLMLLQTSTKETISWQQFTETILNPLREQLVKDGWVTGGMTGSTDAFGRKEIAAQGHKVDFIVLCRMPLRIDRDAQRLEAETINANIPSQMRTNAASVDAELSLLMVSRTPLAGPLPNPLLGKKPTPALTYGPVVRVARLDGPEGTVEKMIENALLAEEIGLRGMAYIDLAKRGVGDEWLSKAAALLEEQYYPVIVDEKKSVMGWRDRIDGAAFYFGWYVQAPRGPIADETLRFVPGALGWHIYSFSAATIRQPKQWTPWLIRAGITGTVGNVFEPFLQLTHRPDLFVEALVEGLTAGEAAYYSLPFLSWMAVYAGDPLYRPFAVSLEAQLAQIEAQPDSQGAQYVVLRQGQKLRAQQSVSAALEYLETAAKRVKGLALSYSIARLLADENHSRRAGTYLQPFLEAETFAVADIPLAWQASELFVQLRQREQALAVLQKIFAIDGLNDDAWLLYAPGAIPLAKQFGQGEQAASWEAKITQIREQREEARLTREAEKKAQAQKNGTK